MKIFLITFLMVISINAFAYCAGGFNDPNHEACIQQEEANRIQKEMLELQRKQLEQQTIDRMMRDGNPRNNNGW